MRITALTLSVLTMVIGIANTKAQEPATRLPRLLHIMRVETSAAKGALVEMTKTNAPTASDAWVAISGLHRTWFVSEFSSYQAWAKALTRVPKSALSPTGGNAIVATLREDLSYQPMALTGSARAISATMVRTHSGHAADYVAERRIVRTAHENAGTKESYSVYQVTAGLPAGTFFVIIPYADIGGLDDVATIHGQAYDRALGDEGRTRTRELTLSGVEESETLLFVLDASLSYRPSSK